MSRTVAPPPEKSTQKPAPPSAFGTGSTQDRRTLQGAELRSAPRPSLLAARIETLKGAGPKLSAAAAEMGLETVGDVLAHVPHSYRDRAAPRLLADLRIGEEATVEVTVRSARVRPTRRRGLVIVEAQVADESGPAKAVWFNQAWLVDRLTEGTKLLLFGKLDRSGFRVEAHEVVGAGAATDGAAGIHTTGIVPVHPASERLRARHLREWAWQARPLARFAVEPLPAELRARRRLAPAGDALAAAHFPEDLEQAEEARRRLAFEELYLHQVALAARRSERRARRRGIPLREPGEVVHAWLDSLPFEPTRDQRRALEEIDRDLVAEQPMQRLLMGEVGSGKAQPLDSLVLAPGGFRRMGDLRVGDQVINPTGERTVVTGVFPQGIREVFRIRFSDGSSVESDADHLWAVRTSQDRSLSRAPKVKPLREISRDLRACNGSPKWHVELPLAAEFDGGGERPLDPYLLGLLLGDGGMSIPRHIRFTSADPELVEAVKRRLPEGCEMRREKSRPYDWVITGVRSVHDPEILSRARREDRALLARAYEAGASYERIAAQVGLHAGTVRYHVRRAGVRSRPSHRPRSPLCNALGHLGLLGRKSRDKAVPDAYLNAPIADRHALLQGLMDTDGTLNKQGLDVVFVSASQELASDVAWLVRSLGGRARCKQIQKAGRTYWRASVILPPDYPPFRLSRKVNRFRPRSKYANPAKAIVQVEKVGRKPVQCIAVAHPNQLYVTDDFTVTHNTVLALHTMLRAVEAGYQAALMAPTETLAEQHAATLDRLLAGHQVPFTLLTSATPAARRREALSQLASGELAMVVGTHALIEPDVEFGRLAVCVVDEQHRFGVRQRAALDGKGPDGAAPHALHMTATPIPRTLSLTAYGDLDATVLRELPAGRQPVDTWVVGEEKRPGAYGFIRDRLRDGRQAYVVCPLVEGSQSLEAKAATQEAERLRATEFKDFEVGLLHGQMPPREKQAAMDRFASGDSDVLVATSVIEVGIDVANATVMLIEGAKRYGLSQLHQLRGRVGRGEHQSQCILFADAASELARRRLEAIATERDGFKLAEVDLALRGEGEILGTRQHGLPRFRIAQLPEDVAVLTEARREVIALLERTGSLEAPELGPLLDAARQRFGDEAIAP